MIELRWYMGMLQYRQWLIRIDGSGALTPLPLPIEWSEWKDVPAFEEASHEQG